MPGMMSGPPNVPPNVLRVYGFLPATESDRSWYGALSSADPPNV